LLFTLHVHMQARRISTDTVWLSGAAEFAVLHGVSACNHNESRFTRYRCEDVGFVVRVACPHASATDIVFGGVEVRNSRVFCSHRI